MKRVELLAPAGDMSKLMTALHFGADAVYVGGSKFSLRANAKNFDGEVLKEAVEYTHAKGKKLYDKRESAARRDAKREMDRVMKTRNR